MKKCKALKVVISNLDDLDQNIILWRYMDFSKFCDLILGEKIYLSPLRKFEDIYEGYFSDVSKLKLQEFSQRLTNFVNYGKPFIKVEIDEKEYEATEKLVYFTYANCWHSNKFESAAMWKLYAQTNEAIAIKTTVANLLEAVKPDESLRKDGFFCVKEIVYVDYDDVESFPKGYKFIQPIEPLFTKRLSFKHESEIRLAYLRRNLSFPRCYPADKCRIENMSTSELEEMSEVGIHANVDLKKLINKVYVAPDAPNWFYEMTKAFLAKMGLEEIACEQSSLYKLK